MKHSTSGNLANRNTSRGDRLTGRLQRQCTSPGSGAGRLDKGHFTLHGAFCRKGPCKLVIQGAVTSGLGLEWAFSGFQPPIQGTEISALTQIAS